MSLDIQTCFFFPVKQTNKYSVAPQDGSIFLALQCWKKAATVESKPQRANIHYQRDLSEGPREGTSEGGEMEKRGRRDEEKEREYELKPEVVKIVKSLRLNSEWTKYY